MADTRYGGARQAAMGSHRYERFELSCCMAVGDAIYVGTNNARMLTLSDGSGVIEPIEGFNNVAGRDAWFAGSAIVNGQRPGPPLDFRSVASNSNGTMLFANVHGAFRARWMAEEPGSLP